MVDDVALGQVFFEYFGFLPSVSFTQSSYFSSFCYHCYYKNPCDKWVPVTTAWRVLRLRMEERPPIWRIAANILNKQSRTAEKGWSSSLGVGRGANNSSPWKRIFVTKYSQTKPRAWTDTSVRPKQWKRDIILWTGLSWLKIETGGGHLWMR
jgi:hypothetical protein